MFAETVMVVMTSAVAASMLLVLSLYLPKLERA